MFGKRGLSTQGGSSPSRLACVGASGDWLSPGAPLLQLQCIFPLDISEKSRYINNAMRGNPTATHFTRLRAHRPTVVGAPIRVGRA
jgi:hypothetical protein